MATPPSPSVIPGDETLPLLAEVPGPNPGQEPSPPGDLGFDFQLPGCDNRERALPIRQGDLTRLLLAEPSLSDEDRGRLADFRKRLGATFHSEFFEKIRELKELYAPLDPDSDYVTLKEHTRPLMDSSDEDFLVPFERALLRANYRALDNELIKAAVTAPNEMGLTYAPDFNLFEHIRVYVRGYTKIIRDCRNFKSKFRKRAVTLDGYQRLIVVLKFKPGENLGPDVRSDVMYLRLFKDVPHVDMEMHLPEQGTKVRMRWIDKAQIASPFAVGLPTLAWKILSGLTFSLSAPMLTALMVPISAGFNSFFGFHRAKQKHLYAMIHKLYYMTLANNASVITRVIDSAEDEEYKEAMLAYFFLWKASIDGSGSTVSDLDTQIEAYLKEKTGVEIDFEVSDALGKLFRLGLLIQDHRRGLLLALPLDQALRALDRHWDATFHYE